MRPPPLASGDRRPAPSARPRPRPSVAPRSAGRRLSASSPPRAEGARPARRTAPSARARGPGARDPPPWPPPPQHSGRTARPAEQRRACGRHSLCVLCTYTLLSFLTNC
ncbi:unnamed protein product [Rangifer tarandus platyrhynchus]|uniref:Uncharacterized protein n=3 Tax=Rangifer tarandus platyrhynchus TaxID=3082113 RepID=A0ACB0E1R6_RANTA|nr:unnamed protein product [Rangifer tarandus platyrhynchus]CAI9694423.1 unnamed protein product [Rangifer tarandus platyrhynchus]CAI9694431.1 unnamed protein product [Rangifer tarandus platyrhynchus]